jgi:hypothetical protein
MDSIDLSPEEAGRMEDMVLTAQERSRMQYSLGKDPAPAFNPDRNHPAAARRRQ